jgi:hypothetical protein
MQGKQSAFCFGPTCSKCSRPQALKAESSVEERSQQIENLEFSIVNLQLTGRGPERVVAAVLQFRL